MMSDLAALGQPRRGLGALFARYRYATAAFDQAALSVFGFGLNLCL